MKVEFNPSQNHNVTVNLNADSGLCDVTVTNRVDGRSFSRSLSLSQYNSLMDFLAANDHQYAINQAERRFVN